MAMAHRLNAKFTQSTNDIKLLPKWRKKRANKTEKKRKNTKLHDKFPRRGSKGMMDDDYKSIRTRRR